MIRIYNTQTRSKEELQTVVPGEVRMYVCGPTVYDYIHVGNARPLIFFDVVRRYLEYRGYKVLMARNITDIDDKLIKKANAEGCTVAEVAGRFTQAFLEDAEQLNTLVPTFMPKATEHIPEIIALVQTLLDKDMAYVADNGDVYFNTQNLPTYGQLSGQKLEDLEAGARIDVDDRKRHPMDFALWKAAKPGEPMWNAPWGQGRPGWHIECSAMSMKYLGSSLDIHGGGQDLVFPHHENEKAQSEGATGEPFVRYWMHNGYINIDNKKMSKSLGNFFTVRDIFEKFPPETLRFFQLMSHYRSPVNFSFELMQSAHSALERLHTLQNFLQQYKGDDAAPAGDVDTLISTMREGFVQNMDDDFNTADALSVLFEYVRAVNIYFGQARPAADARKALVALQEICAVLGILQQKEDAIPDEVQTMVAQRAQARKEKNWAESDRLRDAIRAMGYIVEDSREGQKLKKA